MIRYLLSRVAVIAVITPVLPFWCLYMLANGLHRFVDFCILDRGWSTAIADLADEIADWGDKTP